MLIFSLGSILLGSLITLVIMGVILAVFFYIAYHTFHGDLPAMFKLFLIILSIVAVIVLGFLCLSFFF